MVSSSFSSVFFFSILATMLTLLQIYVNAAEDFGKADDLETTVSSKRDIFTIADAISKRSYPSVDDKQTVSEHVDVNINDSIEDCSLVVSNESKYVFQTTLKKMRPRLVQFHINIDEHVNKTSDVFQPSRWYWSYGSTSSPYQFLSWSIDYGVFSFGLLDYKTALVPRVDILVHGHCNLTLGTEYTSELITNALIPIISFNSTPDKPIVYKESYFCYIAVNEELLNTVRYYAAVYILFPIVLIHYKCCFVTYNFTTEKFVNYCSKDVSVFETWTNIYYINMTLGCLIIGYCPLLLFKIVAWLCRYDNLGSNDVDAEQLPDEEIDGSDKVLILDEDWIIANGNAPFTFFDAIGFQDSCLTKRWPIGVSRLRRFICLLLAPTIIYFKLYMYNQGIGVWKKSDRITIKDFVDVGTPYGFMTFLADASNRDKVFAPIFGGTVGISLAYFVLGFLFVVLPKYFERITENGLLKSNILSIYANSYLENEGVSSFYKPLVSPLFFGTNDVIILSQIKVNFADLKTGCRKCETLMRCNFYMLFTKTFWCQVFQIQTERISYLVNKMPTFAYVLGLIYIPVYIVLCVFEITMCVIYFGVPFVFLFAVMIRSAMTLIPNLRQNYTLLSYMFSIRFTRFIGNIAVFISILVFAYCIFLLIVCSFKFVTLLIAYSFVAIILYPSNSFGVIFLSVIIVYYILRQLKHFSHNYSRLFFTAVAITKRISETKNHVTCYNGHLVISNVDSRDIIETEVNHILLTFSQTVGIRPSNVVKVMVEDKCYSIPKELFSLLIHRFRPVHKYILFLLLRVCILISCVLLFLTVTQSSSLVPEHQLSDVMHVLLIIVVGAMPKLIEADIIGQSNTPKEKIERKNIEECIIEFWKKTNENQ